MVNFEKKLPRSGFVHLAKTKGSSISTSITYIAFVTKLQKRQIPEKRFALIKKRYHNQLNRCWNDRYIAVSKDQTIKIVRFLFCQKMAKKLPNIVAILVALRALIEAIHPKFHHFTFFWDRFFIFAWFLQLFNWIMSQHSI